jgi:hypothetical protein
MKHVSGVYTKESTLYVRGIYMARVPGKPDLRFSGPSPRSSPSSRPSATRMNASRVGCIWGKRSDEEEIDFVGDTE